MRKQSPKPCLYIRTRTSRLERRFDVRFAGAFAGDFLVPDFFVLLFVAIFYGTSLSMLRCRSANGSSEFLICLKYVARDEPSILKPR